MFITMLSSDVRALTQQKRRDMENGV